MDACCAMMRPACSRMQVKVHNNLNSARVEYFVDDFPPSVDCFWHAEQSDVKQKMITLGIKLMLEKKIS